MIKVFHGIDEYLQAKSSGKVPAGQTAVTLGKFDGVHLGHQKLLRKILEREDRGQPGIMFTIESRSKRILSERERAEFVSDFGIDILIECPFSKELMMTSPEDFVSGILKDVLNASFVTVGTDFRFGFQRAGDVSVLSVLGEKYHYHTCAVEKERYEGEEISSTRIRKALEEGNMELAEALLGRPYPVWGEVVHGREIGRTIGLPTANVIPDAAKILPPDGVYSSVMTLEDGRRFGGVTNIGKNPTIADDNVRNTETNLFGFDEDIYGSFVKAGLYHYQRGEMKFGSVEELSGQMHRDSENSGKLLRGRGLI